MAIPTMKPRSEVPKVPPIVGQQRGVTQKLAAESVGQRPPETQTSSAQTDVVIKLRDLWRYREDHRQQVQSTLGRMLSIIRRETGCKKSETPLLLKQVLKEGLGQSFNETQRQTANGSGQILNETHWSTAAEQEEVGHPMLANHVPAAGLFLLVSDLQQQRKISVAKQLEYEKAMIPLVHQLRIWPWAEAIRGVSENSIAGIVAEATVVGHVRRETQHSDAPKESGHEKHDTQSRSASKNGKNAKKSGQHRHETQRPDARSSDAANHNTAEPQTWIVRCIEAYSNPAKLWKRLGIGLVNSKDGQSIQRKMLDVEKAKEHGYNPRRRSFVFNIGENLVKQNDGKYRAAYDSRKVYEQFRAKEEGKVIVPAGQIVKGKTKLGQLAISPLHIHRRARRCELCT